MGYYQRQRLEVIVAKEFALAAILLLVAMIQTALPAQPGMFMPNLLVLLTVCQTLLIGPGAAARWAFYGGLALDICGGSILSMHALALLAVVVVVSFMLARLSHSNWLLPLLGVPLGIVIYHTILIALLSLTIKPIDIASYALVSLLPDLLVTLIPTLPIFLLMRWWHEQHPEIVARYQ